MQVRHIALRRWWRALPDEVFVKERAMVLAILLAIGAVSFACWLLFTLAIYALPFYVAVSTGLWAINSGMGVIGAIMLAFVAGGATLLVGRALAAGSGSPMARYAVVIFFVAPAALAGYHTVHGITGLALSTGLVRHGLGCVGAFVIGATCWCRIAGEASHLSAEHRPAGPTPA